MAFYVSKTILVASDKSPDGTGVGRIKRSEGSNLLESSSNKSKSWSVGERASRILTLSLLCAVLSVSSLFSTADGICQPMGLMAVTGSEPHIFLLQKGIVSSSNVLEKGSDWPCLLRCSFLR